MAVATRFGTSVRWTPPRWLLLAAGAGFGYVMLASGGSVLIVAAFVGGPALCSPSSRSDGDGPARMRRNPSAGRAHCHLVSRDAALIWASPMIAGWLISP